MSNNLSTFKVLINGQEKFVGTYEQALSFATSYAQTASSNARSHQPVIDWEIVPLTTGAGETEMSNKTTFINTDERYGDAYPVTVQDYLDLNPEGNFEERLDGIYEDGVKIAEVTASTEETSTTESATRAEAFEVAHDVWGFKNEERWNPYGTNTVSLWYCNQGDYDGYAEGWYVSRRAAFGDPINIFIGRTRDDLRQHVEDHA